jgi:hypothetical protein
VVVISVVSIFAITNKASTIYMCHSHMWTFSTSLIQWFRGFEWCPLQKEVWIERIPLTACHYFLIWMFSGLQCNLVT